MNQLQKGSILSTCYALDFFPGDSNTLIGAHSCPNERHDKDNRKLNSKYMTVGLASTKEARCFTVTLMSPTTFDSDY